MLSTGSVVWLKVSPAEVLRRTAGGTGRPLLDGAEDPLAKATTLLASREPYYARAHHAVETDGVSPAAVADRVFALLEGASS
jgi:shikimate kinase